MSKYAASQAPKCPFCNGEMRIATSKTDRSRGRRFWKCNTSYGTLYCAGFLWDDEINNRHLMKENEPTRGAEEDEVKKPTRLQGANVNFENGIRDMLLVICGFLLLICVLLIMNLVMNLI
ncbi:hypothetical protein L3X38_011061 [Prunus dulcis]|uniref:GRF-type domain-containing protein n=1 Tax=Prunus dulcis TaxID=3755 RepID=A0AAD4WGU1_PRUDU|nr:hypothetical protein L3X38_011061 [Prunus dulcis]